MTEQRLTEQLQLVFTSVEDDVSSTAIGEDAESVVAKCEPERPAVTNSLMEAVCERENLKKALGRVKANKGSPGVDSMTVEQLPDYLRAHWPQHRDELLRQGARDLIDMATEEVGRHARCGAVPVCLGLGVALDGVEG